MGPDLQRSVERNVTALCVPDHTTLNVRWEMFRVRNPGPDRPGSGVRPRQAFQTPWLPAIAPVNTHSVFPSFVARCS